MPDRYFDWKQTSAGKKAIAQQLTPSSDYVRSFRNLSGGQRGLPPGLRTWYDEQFGDQGKSGLMNVQRNLHSPLEGVGSKSKHTIEIASELPINSPYFTVNRQRQKQSLHGGGAFKPGQKGDHAFVHGELPVSEAQQYLLGQEDPKKVYDYDVRMDEKGNAMVLDETGQIAPYVTYWPFTHEGDEIQYRADQPRGPLPPSGVKSTETERFGRPVDYPVSGTFDWKLFPEGEIYGEHEGVSIPMGTQFVDQTSILTPKGAFFPHGIDYSKIIQRSELDIGSLMMKSLAIRDERALDAITKDCFTQYDFILFAHNMFDSSELQKAWDKKQNKFMLTPDEIEDMRMEMDYPITGMGDELGQWEGTGVDALMAAGATGGRGSDPVSWTSKMPGPSFNTPTDFCHAGSKMRDKHGAICESCNVHYEGRYGAENTVNATRRHYQAMMSDPQRFAQAMVALLPQYSMQTQVQGKTPKSRVKVPRSLVNPNYPDIEGRQGYMRWHDAGDLQGPQHLGLISDIARKTPMINHWLPTKQHDYVREYLKAGGIIPENLTLRMSQPWKGQGPMPEKYQIKDPQTGLPHAQIAGSTVARHQIDPNYSGVVCPAGGGKSCISENCNACWRSDISNVDYKYTSPARKGKPGYLTGHGADFTPEDLAPHIMEEYERLNPPVPQEAFEDEGQFKTFTSSPEGKSAMNQWLERGNKRIE